MWMNGNLPKASHRSQASPTKKILQATSHRRLQPDTNPETKGFDSSVEVFSYYICWNDSEEKFAEAKLKIGDVKSSHLN